MSYIYVKKTILPSIKIPDWDFDESTYLPPPTDEHDLISNSILREPKRISNNPNLYQLTSITDLNPSKMLGI